MRPILDPSRDEPPNDAPLGVDEDVGRHSDVGPVRAATLVHQTVLADHLALGVAQDGKVEAVALDHLAGFVRWIDRDAQQSTALLFQCRTDLSETSELSHAERSPETAVEHQQHGPGRPGLAQRHRLTLVIGQREIGGQREVRDALGLGQGKHTEHNPDEEQ